MESTVMFVFCFIFVLCSVSNIYAENELSGSEFFEYTDRDSLQEGTNKMEHEEGKEQQPKAEKIDLPYEEVLPNLITEAEQPHHRGLKQDWEKLTNTDFHRKSKGNQASFLQLLSEFEKIRKLLPEDIGAVLEKLLFEIVARVIDRAFSIIKKTGQFNLESSNAYKRLTQSIKDVKKLIGKKKTGRVSRSKITEEEIKKINENDYSCDNYTSMEEPNDESLSLFEEKNSTESSVNFHNTPEQEKIKSELKNTTKDVQPKLPQKNFQPKLPKKDFQPKLLKKDSLNKENTNSIYKEVDMFMNLVPHINEMVESILQRVPKNKSKPGDESQGFHSQNKKPEKISIIGPESWQNIENHKKFNTKRQVLTYNKEIQYDKQKPEIHEELTTSGESISKTVVIKTNGNEPIPFVGDNIKEKVPNSYIQKPEFEKPSEFDKFPEAFSGIKEKITSNKESKLKQLFTFPSD